MKTLANINDNINIKFNKTMTTISENAESQQVAGNRAEEMMASAIAHEAKMAEIKAAEEQEEKMNLRIIKIKPAGNSSLSRSPRRFWNTTAAPTPATGVRRIYPNNRRASFVSLCGFMVITSCKVFITLLEVFHFLHGFW